MQTIRIYKKKARCRGYKSYNGLQLIIAILLIVLGLIIVVNSAKSYAKSEKNSEKAA